MPRLVAAALVFTSLCFGLADPVSVRAVMLSPGDIVVGGQQVTGVFALYLVNPVSGDRTIISSHSVGNGPDLGLPVGIFLDTNGSLLVSGDSSPGRIIRVDPLTGNRTVVSSASGSPVVGTGPGIFEPQFLDVDDQNRILLATRDGLLRIDPVSGDRTLLSGLGVGNGPAFGENLAGIDQEADRTILVSTVSSGNPGAGAVFRVDPLTGDRTILSDAMHGSGPAFLEAGIVLHGDSIFSATLSPNIASIDAITGNRTTVSGTSVGIGPALGISFGIAIEQSGNLLVTDAFNRIYRVDPITGNRTIMSGSGVGNGPVFGNMYGIFVVPSVPEPTTILPFTIALLGFVAYVGRRRR